MSRNSSIETGIQLEKDPASPFVLFGGWWSWKHRFGLTPTLRPPSLCLCYSSSIYSPMPDWFLMQACISATIPSSLASSSNSTSRMTQSAYTRMSVVSPLLRPGAGFPWVNRRNQPRNLIHTVHTRSSTDTCRRPTHVQDAATTLQSFEDRSNDEEETFCVSSGSVDS